MSQLSESGRHPKTKERDLAYAVLVLERQLDAYQQLHEEDITSLRAAVQELKARIITIAQTADADVMADDDSKTNHSS
jgi:hypothetical protein